MENCLHLKLGNRFISLRYGFEIMSCHAIFMENLARYIIRASFSQERMSYIEQGSKVIYKSKDG
jgi:hypothetical protein